MSNVDSAQLPERMNRRTAAAVLTRHAKARLGPFEQVVLEDVDITDDGIVRMRPNTGLSLVRAGVEHAAADIVALLGDLVVTDRAFRDGTRLGGHRPRAVLTVENLGAFQDAVVPDDVLTVYVPGWNTRIARDALSGLEGVPVIHFGDLDPNGVAILAHLRRWRPDVHWLVPSFWEDYADERGLPKRWPAVSIPPDAPNWIVSLADAGVWLEQEVIVVDPRFAIAVEEAVSSSVRDDGS
ncbi:MAG: Wadjet anti-phage system protein JetD domain-containing protein [Acidobacteriota bacterium]